MWTRETGGAVKIVETDRLYLRFLRQSDYFSLCRILQDPEVMYAYEHAFSDKEVHEWLDRQINRYEEYEYRFGLWAVILKDRERMIGQCGLTMQDFDGRQVLEIGYLFEKEFWHSGYATEAAKACRQYAFDVLGEDQVYSIIREGNTASVNVAKRIGMTVTGGFTKHYYGMDMPHLVYSAQK